MTDLKDQLFEREFNIIVCIGGYKTKIIVEWEFLFFFLRGVGKCA